MTIVNFFGFHAYGVVGSFLTSQQYIYSRRLFREAGDVWDKPRSRQYLLNGQKIIFLHNFRNGKCSIYLSKSPNDFGSKFAPPTHFAFFVTWRICIGRHTSLPVCLYRACRSVFCIFSFFKDFLGYEK